MEEPSTSEEYVTVVDNKGREKIQRVEYIVHDVQGERVYVTADGLAYAQDSLEAKEFYYLVDELDRIPDILSHPDIVVHDPISPEDTLIYYKRIHIKSQQVHQLIAAVVKLRRDIKFFYNMHPQESGKVKGYRRSLPPRIWYINSRRKPRDFGIQSM